MSTSTTQLHFITAGNGWLSPKGTPWALYAALFLIALVIRLAAFSGISLTDDLWYSRYGQFISQGVFAPDTAHTGLRVGVTVPVGILYKAFGADEWTTIILPLLASSIAVPLLVDLGRRIFSTEAAVVAGLLLATFPNHVTSGTILLPEPIAEAYVLIGVLLFVTGWERYSGKLALASGLFFGVAYLAKEIALFVGAAFILWSFFKGRWSFAIRMACGMLVVGLLETAMYYGLTGDPLFRSHMIARTQDFYFTWVEKPSPLGWRLFKAFPRMLLLPSPEFALHSLTALSMAAVAVFTVRHHKLSLLVLWAALPLLYLNFGSSSFSNYTPIAVSERYTGVAYYPLFLLTGAAIIHVLRRHDIVRVVAWALLLLLSLGSLFVAFFSPLKLSFRFEDLAFQTILYFGAPLLLIAGAAYAWLTRTDWHAYALGATILLVLVTGVAGSLACRNMQTYSDDMAALRTIFSKAQKEQVNIVRFEGDRAWKWRFAAELMGRKVLARECPEKCIAVRADAFGVPFAAIVSKVEPEQPQPLEHTFLPY